MRGLIIRASAHGHQQRMGMVDCGFDGTDITASKPLQQELRTQYFLR